MYKVVYRTKRPFLFFKYLTFELSIENHSFIHLTEAATDKSFTTTAIAAVS